MSIVYKKLVELAKNALERKISYPSFMLLIMEENNRLNLKMIPFEFESHDEKISKFKIFKSFIKSEMNKENLKIIELIFYSEGYASKLNKDEYSKEEIEELINNNLVGKNDIARKEVVVITEEVLGKGERSTVLTVENQTLIEEFSSKFISYEDALAETDRLGLFSFVLTRIKNDEI